MAQLGLHLAQAGVDDGGLDVVGTALAGHLLRGAQAVERSGSVEVGELGFGVGPGGARQLALRLVQVRQGLPSQRIGGVEGHMGLQTLGQRRLLGALGLAGHGGLEQHLGAEHHGLARGTGAKGQGVGHILLHAALGGGGPRLGRQGQPRLHLKSRQGVAGLVVSGGQWVGQQLL